MACIAEVVFGWEQHYIHASGITYLVQGSWPLLEYMSLSGQALHAEACSLLGMAKADRDSVNAQQLDVEEAKLFGVASRIWTLSGQ